MRIVIKSIARKSILALNLLLLVACVPATQIQMFVDPSFTASSVSAHGLTVMPTGLGQAVKAANLPELRRQLSQYVSESLAKNMADVKLRPLEQTFDDLQKANLLDSYASVLAAFEQTGLLNGTRMAELAKALNSRYLLIPYLQSARSETIYAGLSTTINHSAVFTYIVWDAENSKSVFEGSGVGYGTTTIFGGRNIIDAIYEAVNSATAKLVGAARATK